jgi:hypothetical protein
MSTVAEDILQHFQELDEAEQQRVASEILRLTRHLDLPALSDEELILSAEDLFLELDRREAQDAHS